MASHTARSTRPQRRLDARPQRRLGERRRQRRGGRREPARGREAPGEQEQLRGARRGVAPAVLLDARRGLNSKEGAAARVKIFACSKVDTKESAVMLARASAAPKARASAECSVRLRAPPVIASGAPAAFRGVSLTLPAAPTTPADQPGLPVTVQ